jgi:hypothetical protein
MVDDVATTCVAAAGKGICPLEGAVNMGKREGGVPVRCWY